MKFQEKLKKSAFFKKDNRHLFKSQSVYQIDTNVNDLKETIDESSENNIQSEKDSGNYWANAVVHYQSHQYNDDSNKSIMNDVNFVSTLKVICKICELKFSLKNLMHKHIRAEHSKIKVIKFRDTKLKLMLSKQSVIAVSVTASLNDLSKKILIVKSITVDDVKIIQGLWTFYFITTLISLSETFMSESVCLNTDASITLIDWDLLHRQNSTISINQMNKLVKFHGIDSDQHQTEEYVNLKMRFLNEWKNKSWIALITHKAYIVNNLWVKMLIIINILGQKKINLILFSKTAYFKACNVDISIEITFKDSYTR